MLVREQQVALFRLGFDPGPIDGVIGPKTKAAMSAFVLSTSDALTAAVAKLPDFIESKNLTRANRPHSTPIDLIVIHTMESAEKPKQARSVARWFAGELAPAYPAPMASAHYCLVPETRVLHSDMSWRPIGNIEEGDRLVATDEMAGGDRGTAGRAYQLAHVTKAKRRIANCLRIECADGRSVICSDDHRWLGRRPQAAAWEWLDAQWLKAGHTLCAPLSPWSGRDDRDAGYLEGLLDGEGSWSSANEVSFAQKEGPVLDRACAILTAWGIPYRTHLRKESGVMIVTLSGVEATMRALGEAGSVRLASKERWIGRSLRSRSYDNALRIVDVERVGEREVVSIETSTRTFIAEGIVSHNCVDDQEIIQCVLECDIAWHAPGANHNGIGIEHSGFASQTPTQWDDAYSREVLAQSAKLVAALCVRFSIPMVKLTADDLKLSIAGRGICGHIDCTNAFSGGKGHTDPGQFFPWDQYIADVKAAAKLLTA